MKMKEEDAGVDRGEDRRVEFEEKRFELIWGTWKKVFYKHSETCIIFLGCVEKNDQNEKNEKEKKKSIVTCSKGHIQPSM